IIVVFNFVPVGRNGYRIGVPYEGTYEQILNTDDVEFGGFGNIRHAPCSAFVPGYRGPALRLCLPPRTAMVLKPAEEASS
ncbi:MAG: alpha amylase C-terminal domain-containing protein, partial [Oscillospiraceae bacterium]|nr:alpha amylase C-terminal domain-containing protein [Oscillospiraceae bacterium]